MLSYSLKNIKHLNKKAVLTFIFFALFISANCGKRKPPLPPVERVSQRVEISGIQRGNKVFLQWTMPLRNASEGSVLNISRADIYRIAEPLNSPLSMSEEEFASRSTLISTQSINAADFSGKILFYTDTLDFAGQAARLRYAIRFVNASGQKASFSNFLLIEPTAKVAAAPSALNADVSQEAITLNWSPPLLNVDGSTPVNIVGYNIYRSETGENKIQVLNSAPVTKNTFSDKTFQFKKDYRYFVRTISLSTKGAPLESLDSEMISVSPIDIFAPVAPGSITIAASPNTISIFFASNPEPDIAGYRIYRSTDPARPHPEWELLTNEILTANTFQDTKVEGGRTYYYYLTAVDKFGNISPASEIVYEKVP